MVLPFFVWNIVPKYVGNAIVHQQNSTMELEVSGSAV